MNQRTFSRSGGGVGGTRKMIVMGTCMCLLENENGAFSVGFCRKKGSLGVGFKEIGPFLV